MASRNIPKDVAHKLHLVTLVGSGISKPWWEKRTLKALGLTKRYTKVVLKNTPQINEQLRMIKRLITVQPVIFKDDSATVEQVPKEDGVVASQLASRLANVKLVTEPFLNEKGEFDKARYEKYVQSFPEDELSAVLSKSHYRGSEMLNRDFYLEDEHRLTDKGERIALYFKKLTRGPTNPARNRKQNLTKY